MTNAVLELLPFVTLVLPCRDEASFITKCLASVLANDYPARLTEILVVDGMSRDGTRDILRGYVEAGVNLRILDNDKHIIPAAMNIGIRAARGEVILKIDVHSIYPSDYVSKCVRLLRQSGADNVGGVLVTEPSADTAIARAIATCLAHPFGSGNSRFRIGASQPVWADTAAFGCYRRDVFDRIGLYDEKLVRSSDMDLNTRLRRAGGRILLVPDIVAHYYPRGRLSEFIGRNLIDGFWALYPLRYGSRLARLRHVMPLACLLVFVLTVAAAVVDRRLWPIPAALVAAYILAAVAVAAAAAARTREPRVGALLPLVFAIRHSAYAAGSLWGAVRAIGGDEFRARTLAAKRVMDVLVAASILIISAPAALLCAVAVKVFDHGPVLHRGERVGLHGRRFRLLKFRTMVPDAARLGGTSTPADDPRLTPIGRFLRRWKLDELPNFVNVLKGDMSIVGPRPQVVWATELYGPVERELLTVRPGITDFASLRFRDEDEILRGSADPDRDYLEKIAPEKIRLGLEYVRTRSLALDIRIIIATIWATMGGDPGRFLGGFRLSGERLAGAATHTPGS